MKKAVSMILAVLGLVLIIGGWLVIDSVAYLCCLSVGCSMLAIGVYVDIFLTGKTLKEDKSHGRMDKS